MQSRKKDEISEAADEPEQIAEQKSTETEEKTKRKYKKVDSGRIIALHNAGRSDEWIADDMGITVQAVRYHLKKKEKK